LIEDKLAEVQKWLEGGKNGMKCENKSELAHCKMAITCLFGELSGVTEFYKKMRNERTAKTHRILKLKYLTSQVPSQAKIEAKKSREGSSSGIAPKSMEDGDSDMRLEAKQLLVKFDSDMEKVKEIQTKTLELSELMQFFHMKIQEQDVTTDQILAEAEKSVKLIEDSNKNLISAKRYIEELGFFWSALFTLLGIILLVLDYVKG
jgi:hypothetical protein